MLFWEFEHQIMKTSSDRRCQCPCHFHRLSIIWGRSDGFAPLNMTTLYIMLLYSLVDESFSEHELAVVYVILRIWTTDNENFIREKVSVPLSLSSLNYHLRAMWWFCTLKLDSFVYNITLRPTVWISFRTWIRRSTCYFENLNTR